MPARDRPEMDRHDEVVSGSADAHKFKNGGGGNKGRARGVLGYQGFMILVRRVGDRAADGVVARSGLRSMLVQVT